MLAVCAAESGHGLSVLSLLLEISSLVFLLLIRLESHFQKQELMKNSPLNSISLELLLITTDSWYYLKFIKWNLVYCILYIVHFNCILYIIYTSQIAQWEIICLAVQGSQEMEVRSLGQGRCPGEGNDNLLQYSCSLSPMDWLTYAVWQWVLYNFMLILKSQTT